MSLPLLEFLPACYRQHLRDNTILTLFVDRQTQNEDSLTHSLAVFLPSICLLIIFRWRFSRLRFSTDPFRVSPFVFGLQPFANVYLYFCLINRETVYWVLLLLI